MCIGHTIIILIISNNVYYTKRAVFDILSEDYLRNTSLILISTFSYYHFVDTSAGELLVTKGITRSVISVSITGSIPPLVNY